VRALEFILTEAPNLSPTELYKIRGKKGDPTRVDIFLQKVKTQSPFIILKDGSQFVVDPKQYKEIENFFKKKSSGQLKLRSIDGKETTLGSLSKTSEFGGTGLVREPTATVNAPQLELPLGQTAQLKEPKLASKGKESYRIKPSHIFPPNTEYNSSNIFLHIIGSEVLTNSEIGRDIQKMAEDIQQGQNPTFVSVKKEYLPAIRDYAGEYLGVCSLYKGIVNFQTIGAFYKHIGLKDLGQVSVSFPSESNRPLADSIGVFRNKKTQHEIWISSKGGGGGAAPSLSSAFKIPDNIASNPEYKKELEFMKVIYDENITAMLQPFYLWNFFIKYSRKNLGRYAEIGAFSNADIEQIVLLAKGKNVTRRMWRQLPDKALLFLKMSQIKPTDYDEDRKPGMIVHYYLTNFICQVVNENNALPNFEQFVREILQNNFIQINASVKSNLMYFDILWPNRDLATGRIELKNKNSMNEIIGKLGFKISAK
jgi:hypothetical protein